MVIFDAPINIKITPQILKLIADLDEFKGSWKAYKNLAPEALSQLRWTASIESVASSTRIEGSLLSDLEVEKLLKNLKIQKFKSRDEQEVAGYAELMNLILESYESIPLTENHIKQLHKILLQFSNKDSRHRGAYKTLSNSVEAFDRDGNSLGTVFQTSSPFETPRAIEALIKWTNEALIDASIHPVLVVGIFVVSFLAIHPFQDGNGRLSRILTILLLLKAGYEYLPYVSMENIIELNKDSYYLALRRTQAGFASCDPDWEPWIVFFLQVLVKQKNKLQTKLDQEKLLYSSLPELSLQILALVKTRTRVNISELETLLKVNRSAIKVHLLKLVNSKHLVKHGKARATWYSLV